MHDPDGAGCEATRHKPARRQEAVNGPPALCWQEGEPSPCLNVFPAKTRHLSQAPARTALPTWPFYSADTSRLPYSAWISSNTRTYLRTSGFKLRPLPGLLICCCRTLFVAFGCRALSDREFSFLFKASCGSISILCRTAAVPPLPDCLPAGRFLDSARCKECTRTYKF